MDQLARIIQDASAVSFDLGLDPTVCPLAYTKRFDQALRSSPNGLFYWNEASELAPEGWIKDDPATS